MRLRVAAGRLLATGLFAVLTMAPLYLAFRHRPGALFTPTFLSGLFLLALLGCVVFALTCLAMHWRTIIRSRSYLTGFCAACLTITVALAALYGIESLKQLMETHTQTAVQADQRYPYMLIATKEAEGREAYGDSGAEIPIRQWERCVHGGTLTCSETPRIAYMRCQSKVLLAVTETHWGSFAFVPRDNAPGPCH